MILKPRISEGLCLKNSICSARFHAMDLVLQPVNLHASLPGTPSFPSVKLSPQSTYMSALWRKIFCFLPLGSTLCSWRSLLLHPLPQHTQPFASVFPVCSFTFISVSVIHYKGKKKLHLFQCFRVVMLVSLS